MFTASDSKSDLANYLTEVRCKKGEARGENPLRVNLSSSVVTLLQEKWNDTVKNPAWKVKELGNFEGHQLAASALVGGLAGGITGFLVASYIGNRWLYE